MKITHIKDTKDMGDMAVETHFYLFLVCGNY